MRIQEIIFIQGDEASEPLEILNEKGDEALIEYLAQWDYGDSPEREVSDLYEIVGTGDSIRYIDDYVLSYNLRLNYCGLIKKIA